jgi:hypothetical protein
MADKIIIEFDTFASGCLPGTLESALSRCGNPCAIGETGGGIVGEYIWAVKALRNRGAMMLIGVKCSSACAMAAVWMRENGGNVCVTDQAVLGFHIGRATYPDENGVVRTITVNPKLPADITAWTQQHGGLNEFPMLELHAPDIYRFFKACPVEVK